MKYSSLRVLIVLGAVCLSACVSLGEVADSLSGSVMGQSDPEIIRYGAPAYIIMIDSLISRNPDDAEVLLAGSRLYSNYATAFVDDVERTRSLSTRAYQYAIRAFCEQVSDEMCAAIDKPLAVYQRALERLDDEDDVPYLYGLATAWAGWIQSHSDNWSAIADLPKVELAIRKVIGINDHYDNGNAHLYLGVLNTQLPLSLGGKPDVGRGHFEKAIAISNGHNLMVKVLYAKHYARLVFDKVLHDRLLNEVLQSNVEDPAFTLVNTLAKKQARAMLAESDDYF